MTEENVRLDLPSPRSWRYVLGYALIVVVASIFVHILWRHWDLALRLVRISPYALSVVALVVTINLLARADYLRQLVRDLGAPVPARECFLLLGTTHMLSMVTLPGAGAAYRVSYLSRQYDVKTLPFANGTALFVIVGVLVWCVLGTAALVACGLDVGNIRSRLLLVTLVLATGLVAVRPAYQVLCLTSNRRLRCIGRLADECFQVSWSRSLRVAVAVAICCAAAQVAQPAWPGRTAFCGVLRRMVRDGAGDPGRTHSQYILWQQHLRGMGQRYRGVPAEPVCGLYAGGMALAETTGKILPRDEFRLGGSVDLPGGIRS